MIVRTRISIAIVFALAATACSKTDQRKAEQDMDEARRKVQPALHEAAAEAKKDAKKAAAAVKDEVKDLKKKADDNSK